MSKMFSFLVPNIVQAFTFTTLFLKSEWRVTYHLFTCWQDYPSALLFTFSCTSSVNKVKWCLPASTLTPVPALCIMKTSALECQWLWWNLHMHWVIRVRIFVPQIIGNAWLKDAQRTLISLTLCLIFENRTTRTQQVVSNTVLERNVRSFKGSSLFHPKVLKST